MTRTRWILFGLLMVGALVLGMTTADWCWYGRCIP